MSAVTREYGFCRRQMAVLLAVMAQCRGRRDRAAFLAARARLAVWRALAAKRVDDAMAFGWDSISRGTNDECKAHTGAVASGGELRRV
jgi:hypothetical protein